MAARTGVLPAKVAAALDAWNAGEFHPEQLAGKARPVRPPAARRGSWGGPVRWRFECPNGHEAPWYQVTCRNGVCDERTSPRVEYALILDRYPFRHWFEWRTAHPLVRVLAAYNDRYWRSR